MGINGTRKKPQCVTNRCLTYADMLTIIPVHKEKEWRQANPNRWIVKGQTSILTLYPGMGIGKFCNGRFSKIIITFQGLVVENGVVNIIM